MYRAKEDLWRGHTERTPPSGRSRVSTWDEHTQAELHEKLSAAQNRSRFGLGFASSGLTSNATCVGVQQTCGSTATASERDHSSSRHALGGSPENRQVSVERRLSKPDSRSKLEHSSAPSRSHGTRGAERADGYNWLSGNCRRKRSTRRSSSRSRSRTERRKRRSHSGASEASYHYRCTDALPTRRNERHREVCGGKKSPSASRDAHEMHTGNKGDETRRRRRASQELPRSGEGRREGYVQVHSSRRRSGDDHGSDRRSSSYARERSMGIRERSSLESGRSRKRCGIFEESDILQEAGPIRRGRSSSKIRAHRRKEVEENTQISRTTAQEKVTQHAESYNRNHGKDHSSASRMQRPRKESTLSFSSCVASCREHSSSAKDGSLPGRSEGSPGGRGAAERGCSQVRGGIRCPEVFSPNAGLCSCGDKESKQHRGDGLTAAAIGVPKEEKRQGGTVPGRTAELPTLCHGSAQEALKQRIREKLREVEQRQGKCSVGDGVKPVLTAREGRLLTCKQLITAESREAFEKSESRRSSNAVLDRQGREQVDKGVQRILEHEDVTAFTAFLERKRLEKLQAAEIRKTAPMTEKFPGTGDLKTDPKRKESGVSSGGIHRGEDSHLDAIFGRNAPDSLKCNKQGASGASTTPCIATAPAGEVVTTTLPGLKGMALLADAVVMQSGNVGAGWKLRRQLQRQQRLEE